MNKRRRNKIVPKGYSADLDCRFNEPFNFDEVTLWKGPEGGNPVKVDGVNVTKSGQLFTINNVQDSWRYWCKVGSSFSRIDNIYSVQKPPGNNNNNNNTLLLIQHKLACEYDQMCLTIISFTIRNHYNSKFFTILKSNQIKCWFLE